MTTENTVPSDSQFHAFADAFESNFRNTITADNRELYRVNISGEALWELYLTSFPEGTNPIFRVRTYHDGSMDRSVFRKIGNVVTIINGQLRSIWDIPALPYPYNVVAGKLRDAVHGASIEDFFLADYETVGAKQTIERLESGDTIRWNHLFANIPLRFYKPGQVDALTGRFRTLIDVMKRGLETITPEAIDTILQLIQDDNLYRGTEFKKTTEQFRRLQQQYDGTNTFLYANYTNQAATFRNTVIGTLAVDLSEGMGVEAAVRAFEAKVAPTNYRRTKSLITPAMVKDAMKTIGELGLESALERRMARASDVSVNNVLWADGAAKEVMKSGVESILMSAATERTKPVIGDTISVDDFLTKVVPEATGIELLFRSELVGNLMSLTAPVHSNVQQLFRWDNNFGWSYNGDITDSIRERVKAAGGNVDAKFRVSLSWFNFDDLDLHCVLDNIYHVSYSNKAGILDVDMNAHTGKTREPVENMAFGDYELRGFRTYRFIVHQFAQREMSDYGFEIEVQHNGRISQYSYTPAVNQNEKIHLFDFVRKGDGQGDYELEMINRHPKLIDGAHAIEVWGLATNKYVPVKMLMRSPNHWDGQATGNQHLFFILDGCKNDQPVRGLYNEFLKSELDKHRKVFEILGDKTKCQPADDQLSGLGFSSTIRKTATVRVTTEKATRQYIIQF